MNTDFKDVRGIATRFVANIMPDMAPELGSVISFDFDGKRKLHLIICHEIGEGGWKNADKYVRFGMDYLDHLTDDRQHSIVQIGTGRVGRRDGADAPAIITAMAQSFLPVTLYIYDGVPMEAVLENRMPLRTLFAWSPTSGMARIAA
ncbi:MAG TPA: hypothetical protein VGB97_03330 [Candidatus Paceibacterota bacterium]|jgi:hypothetical protein